MRNSRSIATALTLILSALTPQGGEPAAATEVVVAASLKVKPESAEQLVSVTDAGDTAVMTCSYYVPTGYCPTGLRVKRAARANVNRMGRSFSLRSSSPVSISSESGIIRLTEVRKFRGHCIAEVALRPVLRSGDSTIVVSDIEFEIVCTPDDVHGTAIRNDEFTLRVLSEMVENRNDLAAFREQFRTGPKVSASTSDSVPCAIITPNAMRPQFEEYAEFLTRSGTRTYVMPLEVIDATYPGDSIQQRVRNYIRECYNERYVDWIILAADIDAIPQMLVSYLGEPIATDQFYSCLDYEWNENGNTLFGEPTYKGDTVDYDPDVFVGRIPCSTSEQAELVIDKLVAYQSDTTARGYQTNGLFSGTNIAFSYFDGKGEYDWDNLDLLYDMKAIVDGKGFNTVMRYEADSVLVMQDLQSGYGLFVSSGMASSPADFHTKYSTYPGGHEWIEHWWLRDQMSDADEFTVFFNFTCFSTALSADSCTARSFMLSQPGGGVGYVGSSFYSWSARIYPDFHIELLDVIFNNGTTRLGQALAESKLLLTPPDVYTDNYRRTAIFAYQYLGDPQMPLWTGEAKVFDMDCPDTLDEGHQVFAVTVHEALSGDPVENAKVCLRFGQETIYQIDYSDSQGRAAFSVEFPTGGYATVVTTKQNFFRIEDTIVIDGAAPGCPTLYSWDGEEYRLENNILAHCERAETQYSRPDFYAMPHVHASNGRVYLRIREDESQLSSIESIRGFAVTYEVSDQPVYTNRNRFRRLAGESHSPVSALHNGRVDVTGLVAGDDGVLFRDPGPGHLIVEYCASSRAFAGNRKGDHPRVLGGSGGGGIEPPPGGKTQQKIVSTNDGSERLRNIIDVSVLRADSTWELVNTVYPRFRHYPLFTELHDHCIDGCVTVKVEWAVEIEIDYLPYETFDDVELALTRARLASAFHSDAGDVTPNLALMSSDGISLATGQQLDLQFEVEAPGVDRDLGFVLVTRGLYETPGENVSRGKMSFDNYPNPCNPGTTFSFSLPGAAHVELVIYNVLGQQVRELVDSPYPAGQHRIGWDGRDSYGRELASGVYFGRFSADGKSSSKKLVLLK